MAETKGEVSAPLACKFVQTGPPDEDGIFYCGYCNRPKEGETADYGTNDPLPWLSSCGCVSADGTTSAVRGWKRCTASCLIPQLPGLAPALLGHHLPGTRAAKWRCTHNRSSDKHTHQLNV